MALTERYCGYGYGYGYGYEETGARGTSWGVAARHWGSYAFLRQATDESWPREALAAGKVPLATGSKLLPFAVPRSDRVEQPPDSLTHPGESPP